MDEVLRIFVSLSDFAQIVLCQIEIDNNLSWNVVFCCLLLKLDEDLIIERLFDFPVRPLTTE